MPRKLFLSFLGTNNYEPVSYYLASERKAEMAPLEKYVQKTLLRHLARTFGPGDKAVFFLTEEARQSNWLDNGHLNRQTGEPIPNEGLNSLIEKDQYVFTIEAIDINGESEPAAIWDTFQTVYEQMEPQDEVYLDITHSWRYLPMLGMTLLNFAKVLKNIQVQAIFYGAFEQLGTVFEVKQKSEDERPVPILDLVSFSELQDWTVAADDFVLDGNPQRLSQLTQKNLSPILAESRGKDEAARNLNEITERLTQLVAQIETNRGREIREFNYEGLQKALESFSEERSYIKPMNSVMEHIRAKVVGFQTGSDFQWLEAADWCRKHNLVQQGITQLQEGLITWLCGYCERKGWGEPGYFDPYRNRRGRDLLSRALQFIQFMPPEEKWTGQIGRHKQLAYQIMEDELAQQLSAPFSKLAQLRNDINHGGFTNNTDANAFYSGLEACFQKIHEVLSPFFPAQKKEIGLLNISNHPSERWSDAQKEAALQEFGPIHDLPFPNIDPNLTDEELDQLTSEYLEKVLALSPTAVHLMGEMTFTFALLQKLQAAGIPCIASTTERKVEEVDGKKVVEFRFVQFRKYF